jgi:hypothetical protein
MPRTLAAIAPSPVKVVSDHFVERSLKAGDLGGHRPGIEELTRGDWI